jgi:hypothetical protein
MKKYMNVLSVSALLLSGVSFAGSDEVVVMKAKSNACYGSFIQSLSSADISFETQCKFKHSNHLARKIGKGLLIAGTAGAAYVGCYDADYEDEGPLCSAVNDSGPNHTSEEFSVTVNARNSHVTAADYAAQSPAACQAFAGIVNNLNLHKGATPFAAHCEGSILKTGFMSSQVQSKRTDTIQSQIDAVSKQLATLIASKGANPASGVDYDSQEKALAGELSTLTEKLQTTNAGELH